MTLAWLVNIIHEVLVVFESSSDFPALHIIDQYGRFMLQTSDFAEMIIQYQGPIEICAAHATELPL